MAGALELENGMLEITGIKPMDDVAAAAESLNSEENIMLVGHLPHLSKLITRLIHEKDLPDTVSFKQGGVCCLFKSDIGLWSIAWMIVPQIL